uniref:Uncharacterized protein n=1 Tax=Tanacetum cinerariifolium TaxID=118510 RepID=A0A699RBI5_TANCI|nr:hypothetical protein [Tanacetum cinerariifolium]
MVRLWWLLWPQPVRSPPQRWRQMAEHSEAPLGVAPPQPDTTWCGCGGCTIGLRHHSPTPQGAAAVAVPSPDRHHNGGLAADSSFST